MKDVLLGREKEALDLVAKIGVVKAAAALGVHRSSVTRLMTRLRNGSQAPLDTGSSRDEIRAAAKGELGFDPVLPGFEIKQTSTTYDAAGNVERQSVVQSKAPAAEPWEVPKDFSIARISANLDAEKRWKGGWIIQKPDAGPSLEQTIETIKAAFANYKPAARRSKPPAYTHSSLLSLLPLADCHIGMHAWGREVGTDWDLQIASKVIGDGVEEAIERSPASDTFVVLGGGDLLHADNQDNKTAKSGNQLDVDGRYQKVVGVANDLLVRTVDAALRRHGKVIVRILKGNHDEHSAIAAAYFMLAWYRNDPRVTVDVDPSLFWWHRWGLVQLGATHGHTVKLKDMPSIMAHRRAEDWGRTRFRYVHGFHIHHASKYQTEGQGCIAESHQAPVPQDAWHYGAGFLSGRSIQTITYHEDFGEVSRARVAIIDAVKEAA